MEISHSVSGEILSNLSPIIFEQNKNIIKMIASSFDLDETKICETILPKYLDCLSLVKNKKNVSCTALFPGLTILHPKSTCLARIVSGDKVSQCCNKRHKGHFCKHHQNHQPWGIVTIPQKITPQICHLVLNQQEPIAVEPQNNDILCEEWIIKGIPYYWDTNSDKVYTEEGDLVGYRKGNILERINL